MDYTKLFMQLLVQWQEVPYLRVLNGLVSALDIGVKRSMEWHDESRHSGFGHSVSIPITLLSIEDMRELTVVVDAQIRRREVLALG